MLNSMKSWGLFVVAVLLASALAAETRTYLVYRKDNFPQDRYLLTASPLEFKYFIETGKKDMGEAGGQPFRITSYEISYDGKYALWTVSYLDEDEHWRIDSMENKKYIVLLSSSEVVSVYEPRVGKYRLEVNNNHLAELPTDFYQVSISTQ